MDIAQVEIVGPCRITYKGIDLGHTIDGVSMTIERSLIDVKVDRYGDSPIDEIVNGAVATIKFKLAQNNIRNQDILMPETSTADAANDRADIGADAGYSLRSDAGLLVIHPLKYANGDLSHDWNLYKAVNVSNPELVYTNTDQLVYSMEMKALVDESYGSGRRLGHIGYAALS